MPLWLWLAYFGVLAVLAALDAGVFNRRPRKVTPVEARTSTMLWILAAIGVGLLLANAYGNHWLGLGRGLGQTLTPHAVWLQFIAAYTTEFTLSLDNLAVFALLFEYMRVSPALRHRVLFWTTVSCVTARALLIGLGYELLTAPWIPYLFAGLLALSMLRTMVLPDEKTDFDGKLLVRAARRIGSFFGKPAGRVGRLPLVGVALVAAAADLSFNADAIPAVFAVTHDPVIAVVSNTLAILALRSLYFSIAGVIGRFRFLKIAITAVLLTLVVKTILMDRSEFATALTLGIVAGALGLAVLFSIMRARRLGVPAPRPTPLEDVAEAVTATRRSLRKVLILIAGTVVILLGIAIAPLPGPGFLILAPIGLAILATEFVWAKRLKDQMVTQAARVQAQASTLASRTSRWIVPVAILGFAGVVYAVLRYTELPMKLVIPVAGGLTIPLGYWAYLTLKPRASEKHAGDQR